MDYQHDNNVYAHDITNHVRHISEVASGRKGYYCMGCAREMQAKKGEKYAHHFSHDPKDVDNKGKCTYSDETYRHKLAKDVLQDLKRVKVPAVYKYPPAGEQGKPRKIHDARFIEAHRVEIEMPFFETENGDIAWGRNWAEVEHPDKYLLIQPDVAFFDAHGEPILLIELVATHKVDAAKLVKIRHLGLDVIQVSVPKESPQEIQNSFNTTSRTKWLYNYEQEQADYLRIPERSDEGVLPLDEFERKLLKSVESFACRASQINNLLRTIGKCMDSQPYRASEQSIVGEIRRVTDNAERVREEFCATEERYTAEIERRLRPEAERLDSEGADLSEREQQFRSKVADLEGRYNRKRRELIDAQADYRPECQSEIERVERDLAELGASGGTASEGEEEISEAASRIEQNFSYAKEAIERTARNEQAATEATANRIEQGRTALPLKYAGIEGDIKREFAEREAQLQLDRDAGITRVRKDFERDRTSLLTTIENGYFEEASRTNRRIKDVLDAGGLLGDIHEKIGDFRRLRKAKELFDKGTYKSWE